MTACPAQVDRIVQPAMTFFPGRFVLFLLAGGLSLPFNLLSRSLFSRYLSYEIAVVLAHFVGMIVAFILMRRYAFEKSTLTIPVQFSRFTMTNLLSLSMTWICSVGLVRIVFPAIDFQYQAELVAHVIALGVASIFSFFMHSRFSFKRTMASPTS